MSTQDKLAQALRGLYNVFADYQGDDDRRYDALDAAHDALASAEKAEHGYVGNPFAAPSQEPAADGKALTKTEFARMWRAHTGSTRFSDEAWEAKQLTEQAHGIGQSHPAPSRDAEDAARYRWLRDEAWGGNNKTGPHLVMFKPGLMPSAVLELAEQAADEAIDAARAKKEQG